MFTFLIYVSDNLWETIEKSGRFESKTVITTNKALVDMMLDKLDTETSLIV